MSELVIVQEGHALVLFSPQAAQQEVEPLHVCSRQL